MQSLGETARRAVGGGLHLAAGSELGLNPSGQQLVAYLKVKRKFNGIVKQHCNCGCFYTQNMYNIDTSELKVEIIVGLTQKTQLLVVHLKLLLCVCR